MINILVVVYLLHVLWVSQHIYIKKVTTIFNNNIFISLYAIGLKLIFRIIGIFLLFKNYIIKAVKALDFVEFCKVENITKSKSDISIVRLDLIRIIKVGLVFIIFILLLGVLALSLREYTYLYDYDMFCGFCVCIKVSNKIPIKLTVQQYKPVNNYRFFSSTGYKYMDEDMGDYSDTDSNSQISEVSDMTVDSKISNPKDKLNSTQERIKSIRDDLQSNRAELKMVNNDLDDLSNRKKNFLSSDKKEVYEAIYNQSKEEIDESIKSQRTKAGGTEKHKRDYDERANEIIGLKSKLVKLCSDFIFGEVKNTYSDNEKNEKEIKEEAQENLTRDLTTRRENTFRLIKREKELKSLQKKRPDLFDGNNNNSGESSQGAPPNQNNQSNPYSDYDYGNPNNEMQDFF